MMMKRRMDRSGRRLQLGQHPCPRQSLPAAIVGLDRNQQASSKQALNPSARVVRSESEKEIRRRRLPVQASTWPRTLWRGKRKEKEKEPHREFLLITRLSHG